MSLSQNTWSKNQYLQPQVMIDNQNWINLTERFMKRGSKVRMNLSPMMIGFERLNFLQEKFLNQIQNLKLMNRLTKTLQVYSICLEFQIMKLQSMFQKRKSLKSKEIFDNRSCKPYIQIIQRRFHWANIKKIKSLKLMKV